MCWVSQPKLGRVSVPEAATVAAFLNWSRVPALEEQSSPCLSQLCVLDISALWAWLQKPSSFSRWVSLQSDDSRREVGGFGFTILLLWYVVVILARYGCSSTMPGIPCAPAWLKGWHLFICSWEELLLQLPIFRTFPKSHIKRPGCGSLPVQA